MRSLTVAALAAAGVLAAGIPGLARAADPAGGCTTAPAAEWLTIDQLKARVAAQGYVIWKGRIDNGCADIAAYPSRTGALERLRVDPSSGRIVETR
jgi:hypothetical protein